MNARRIVVDTPSTPHFDFLFGRYRLSPWVIPYFSTIIPISLGERPNPAISGRLKTGHFR